MKDEDDVQGVEFPARDSKCEADKDGVEDDAELEDEDCSHLRCVVFDEPSTVRVIFCIFVVVVDVMAVMAEVIFARGVRGSYARFALNSGGRMLMLRFIFRGSVVVVKGCVAHGHEFGEEEDEDGHKGNTLYPIILRDGAGEAWICESIVGRSEEVDERGCYDDPRPEVFGDEEGPFGDPDTLVAGGVDGGGST